jgi:DNA-binding CsgD family transcriptional regulator
MKTGNDILSAREIEVLKLQMKNYDPQGIADKLKCSLATVKTHIRHIHAKLNVNTSSKAISWGFKNGLDKR